MWRPSLADKQVNNVEVVVMDSDVQRSQAVLQTQNPEVVDQTKLKSSFDFLLSGSLCLSYLPSSVGVCASLQQQLCYIHLPVF